LVSKREVRVEERGEIGKGSYHLFFVHEDDNLFE
jgi:hypothetical protein